MKPVYRIKKGSRAGIVCCSDGRKIRTGEELDRLTGKLESLGLRPQLSPCIYARDGAFSGTGRERAQALMDFYRDDSIRVIFDISGGNAANEVLPFLDYSVIAGADKLFWGYSDLTVILNAIYAKTGRASMLWQVRNLLYERGEEQTAALSEALFGKTENGESDKETEPLFFLSHSFHAEEPDGRRCRRRQSALPAEACRNGVLAGYAGKAPAAGRF